MATSGIQEEFLSASRQALRQTGGNEALRALDWWDLLADLADPAARAAVFALFWAQGLELASTGALGGLMAHPYVACSDIAPASVAATVTRHSIRRGPVTLVVGDLGVDHLLLDRLGLGAVIVEVAHVDLRPVELPGRLVLHEVDADRSPAVATITEEIAVGARRRSHFLGRVACAFEILGAAEAALARAVEHACARTQFGQPIGTFQAVRHLLAWAKTDCAAIHAVAEHAMDLDEHAPPRYDEMLKVLAGRSGRRVCERTLQVLGAIGFTAEHEHHHFHSRVLALDAVLGTSADLARDLGRWLREEGAAPPIAATTLLRAGSR